MDELIATYRIRTTAEEAAVRADALLLEQTVELPRSALHDAEVLGRAVGRVVDIAADAAGEQRVALAQPVATTAHDPAQLMNVLFGNASLQPDVELVDVTLPPSLLRTFGGPRFGLQGLRRLTGVEGRALTCAALKPMGLPPEKLAALCRTLALAGVDIIKDDHGLADQSFAPFIARVRACQAAAEAAAQRTGRRSLYVPSITGTPGRLRAQVDAARSAGVRAVLVSPMLIGLPAFHELVRERLDLPVIAHPALGGAQRIAPLALLGKLFPLFGADAVIFPNAGGRFSYDRETCSALASALRRPPAPLRAAFPVPAGGIKIERVAEVIAAYGPDTILLVGGSLLDDPARVLERGRQFVEAVLNAPA